jgi:AcrR family transcriptional regulator
MDLTPTFKERQHTLREQEILDAAERKLSTAGYAGFTLDEIAADVGISKPTLYLHFKSKDEMLASVGARVIRRADDFLESLPESMCAIDRLRAIIGHMVQARFGPNGLMFGAEMPISVLITQACIRSAETGIKQKLTEIIHHLQEEGVSNNQISATILTSALLSFVRDYWYEEMVATGMTTPEELCESWLAILAPFVGRG